MSSNDADLLFIVDLTYIAPLDEIDRALPEHVEFLTRQYDAGHFLMSGPKSPRTGGVILAKAASKADLEAIVDTDPFRRDGMAETTITSFEPRRISEALRSGRVFQKEI